MIRHALIAAALTAALTASAGSRLFNDSWRFNLGDTPQAAMPDYDDSQWRTLNLPHDWTIEGDFSPDNPSGTAGGALPGGIGWYRKHLRVEPGDTRRRYIEIDGAYMNATVSVNGKTVGTRPYGYISYCYDITPFLAAGDNVIAIKVDNAEQPNSRWYSGCGIYRNVRLREVGDVHVAYNGYHVANALTKPGSDKWRTTVTTEIVNKGDGKVKVKVITSIIDGKGDVVAAKTTGATAVAGATTPVTQTLDVVAPRRWQPGAPNLYRAVTVVTDGLTDDTVSTHTGFRTLTFDPVTGFAINGKRMKLNGVCLHHDQGALGAAVNRRAIERQLEIMQEMGVNAIRCSHNPPAPELLQLCDSMGLMVMDEAFDMWRKRKTAHDYARYFNDWHEADLTDMVRRDRNHPCIIMWSIGNEVLEQWTDTKADTLSLEQANLLLNLGRDESQLAGDGMSVNSLLTAKLAGMVRQFDPEGRPVTAGCNEPRPKSHLFRSGALDIIGYNYHNDWIKDVPQNFPGMPFLLTESVSGVATRGFYSMPSDSVTVCPKRWDLPYTHPSMACSSYDNCRVPWGNTHRETMHVVEDNDFVMGQFVWTGFDYIGEPTPYQWPARSSYFGIVDLAGFPKDIYYFYQSRWRPDRNVLHLFPAWEGTPGEEIDMWAYVNNADEVELKINGRSVGRQKVEPSTYNVVWRVPFEPGTVTAISRKDGKIVATERLTTAGRPHALRLTADRDYIAADGFDLSYVTVEAVDRDGNPCPLADNDVTFDVYGCGFNAGVDNGSPVSLERFKADRRKLFNGRALLIVRSDGNAGSITVNATAPGLKPASLYINAAR